LGLPSTGKTSILNTLVPSTSKKPVAPLVPLAASAKNPEPTTKAPSEVVINAGEGMTVRVIDTPGWEYVEDDDEGEVEADEAGQVVWDDLEERVAGDLLRRNLGRVDRVKDLMPLGQLRLASGSHN
jgi:nuclear GTP-binding protein